VAVPASTDVTITASLGGMSVAAVLTVTGSPLAINTGGLACTNGVCGLGPGNVGTFFSQAISQSGGTGPTPFTWTLVAGALPDGLTLNDPRQCGVHCVTITGTPTTAQTTTFTILVQDSAGATAQQAFNLTINPPRPLVITSASPAASPARPAPPTG
jgi:putative Ig domain-containing protein